MITEQDLQEAIAECEGVRNPNANTCIKLAAFYTIRQHMFGTNPDDIGSPQFRYSFAKDASVSQEEIVGYSGESEFSQLISGRNAEEMWALMDELMLTLQVINPRLYDGVMRKIAE